MLHPPPPPCDTTPTGGAVGNVRRGEEKRALDMEEDGKKVGQWSKVSGRENLPKFSLALFHFFSPGDQRPLPKPTEGDYALGWRRMPLSFSPFSLHTYGGSLAAVEAATAAEAGGGADCKCT